MAYLLDAHTLIWYFEQNNKLSKIAEDIIDDPENSIYVCSATLWEIALKISLGKLDVDFDELLASLREAQFPILHIESVYMRGLIDLPMIHKDPFDRILIVAANIEDMTLITADENIHKYSIKWKW